MGLGSADSGSGSAVKAYPVCQMSASDLRENPLAYGSCLCGPNVSVLTLLTSYKYCAWLLYVGSAAHQDALISYRSAFKEQVNGDSDLLNIALKNHLLSNGKL